MRERRSIEYRGIRVDLAHVHPVTSPAMLQRADHWIHSGQLVERPRVPKMSVHGLRREHASNLPAQGVEIALVGKRLGHSAIAVTSDLYSHLLRDAGRSWPKRAEPSSPGAQRATQWPHAPPPPTQERRCGSRNSPVFRAGGG